MNALTPIEQRTVVFYDGNYSVYQLFHHKEAKITKKILKNFVFFVSLWFTLTMAE